MTREQLADLLGISASMVSRLAKRGMPTDDVERAKRWRRRNLEPGRVKGARVDTLPAMAPLSKAALPAATPLPTPAAEGCLVEGAGSAAAASAEEVELSTPGAPLSLAMDPSYQDARARQAQADARIAELKLAELEGQLIRVDQVIAAFAGKLAPVREALLQIPARLAPLVASKRVPGRVQTMLEAEIHQVLDPLSTIGAELVPKGTGG